MSERDLIYAANTAIHQLERSGYTSDKAIGYTHPADITAIKQSLPEFVTNTDDVGELCGVRIEDAPTLDRGVFVLVHLDAMRYGPDAVQAVSFEVDE